MEKIRKLRKFFDIKNIDGYIINKNDEFFGEYISNFKDRLKYISNFSGSSGFAIILKKYNYLFVDGRYTLQGERESGKNFKIITFPYQMPKDVFKKKIKLGFDPRIVTKKFLNIFFKKSKITFLPLEENLVDEIWKRKEKKKVNKFYFLPYNSVDQNYNFKKNGFQALEFVKYPRGKSRMSDKQIKISRDVEVREKFI